MKIAGPDSKYMMQWGGAWRAVVHMYDASKTPTTLGMRATSAVLFIARDAWVACAVFPGEIVERPGRDPNARHWDTDV